MEKDLEKLSNKELIQLLKLIIEHQDYLNSEKEKLENEETK